MKKQCIPVNLFWVAIILVVIACYNKEEKGGQYCLMAAAGAFILQLAFGKTKVYNLSGKPIYKKDKDSNKVTAVPSFRSADHLDGVGLLESGKVVRICESTRLICLPGGHYIYAEPISWGVNLVLGGGTIDTTPNDSWKPLFDKVEKGGN